MPETVDTITNFRIEDRWGVCLAVTTQSAIEAARVHQTSAASSIVMARTLSAVSLISSYQGFRPSSVQIICQGALKQSFADINEEGHLRSYVGNNALLLNTDSNQRPTFSASIGRGELSIIRKDPNAGFQQSSCVLVGGEIDNDLTYFLHTSDQIQGVAATHVHIDEKEQISHSVGILVHALPDANPDRREHLQTSIQEKFRSTLLLHHEPEAIIKAVFGKVVSKQHVKDIQWQCRCSQQRVQRALRMLGAETLAEMVDQKEEAKVDCDFCGAHYVVSAQDVEKVFIDMMVATNQ